MDLYTIRQQLNIGIPLTKIPLRVTDYSRVSTTNKLQQTSLKNQVEHFDKMIKDNPNWTYIPGYIDEGITGTSDIKRDNFMQMIEDAKKDKFDLIITKEISRFSRNTLDSIKYTRQLLEYGVAVLFINDNINTALPDSELRLTIMASMAQDEIRRLSERVKFGMTAAINRGTILGNNMLYGYKKNKATGKLLIIEEEARLIKRIYAMYALDNLSINKITNILNTEGLRTSQNKLWTTTTIRRMLKNPKYKGFYCGKKTEIVDYMTKKVKYLPARDWILYEDKEKIPPIITEELWNRANKRLTTRNLKFGSTQPTKELYKNRYPLSAKIYCQEHNTVFRRRKQTTPIWSCSKYLTKGLTACQTPHLKETELLTILTDVFNTIIPNTQKITTILLKEYQVNLSSQEELKTYLLEKEKYLTKKKKLIDLNLNNIISNDDLKKEITLCNQTLHTIEEKILSLKQVTPPQQLKLLEDKINTYFTSDYFITKLTALLLTKIIVSKLNNDRTNVNLDIYLNLSSVLLMKKVFKQKYQYPSTTYTVNVHSIQVN